MDVSPAAPAQMEYFRGNTMATPSLFVEFSPGRRRSYLQVASTGHEKMS
jgi:hypothetical protein